MQIATWTVNNRVGQVRFRPEAATAALELAVDVLVLTEYFPQEHEREFTRTLRDAGWLHQEVSKSAEERANRVLVVSRLPVRPLDIALPEFDRQFPSNILAFTVPSVGLSIIGVRIPWYEERDATPVFSAWGWLEQTASILSKQPAIILGDLNVGLKSGRSRGGDHLRRILQAGWHRAVPDGGASFFGDGGKQSEIDHILGTNLCTLSNARYVTEAGGYILAGGREAISDHAALLAEASVVGAR